MASLFSVSRLISKGRPASKRASSEDEASSTHSEAPKERTSYRPTNNKTEETLELPLNISDKASFEEWTDTSEEAIGPSEKEGYFQSGINENAKDSEERSLSSDTNWTPLDIDKKAEESPLISSVLDWTDIQFDRGITSENHLKEERPARLEEISIVKEEKRKLAERVKELEKELQDAVDELNSKMDQISKLILDHDQKELEIEAALEKETSLLAKQDRMQEKMDMMIEELSESQARAAELKSASEVHTKMLLEKDVILASHSDTITVLKRQQTKLIAKVQQLKAESQARAAKLQSASESAKKILRKHAILASCSDTIDLQKANLIAQAEDPRATAKVDERQNCILLVQLGQDFSDGVVVYKGSVAKPVRCITGSTLVEHAVRTVKALNDKIYQFAASLTDCVDEIEKMPLVDSEESDDTVAASETLKSLLADTNICSQLENESHMTKGAYYPFILQTGIQGCLTACCIHIITLWDPAQPEYGKFLEVVYKKIRGSGEARNAAQWREWILQSCTSSIKTARNGVLFSFIIANLYAMLSIAGWPRLRKTDIILDKFSRKISEIVNLAVYLNELAAETTIPGDLQATTEEGGASQGSEGEWDTPHPQVVAGRCMCGICVRTRHADHL